MGFIEILSFFLIKPSFFVGYIFILELALLLRYKHLVMTLEPSQTPPSLQAADSAPSSGKDPLQELKLTQKWQNHLKTNWNAWIQKIGNQLPKKWDKETLKKSLQNFDPQAFVDRASNIFQKRNASFYGTLATLTLSSYFTADIAALIAGQYIPDPAPIRSSRLGGNFGRAKSISDYQAVFSRNLFNSQGLIPGEEGQQSNGGLQDLGGTPVKSMLPLTLIGTIIMIDEMRSIATIEDKAASMIYPVRIEDEIPNKLRVIKIEPRRVIFVNKSSGRREYLDLPEELQGANPTLTAGKPSVGGGIEKVAPTQFNVSRSEVDKALADFNNILTQARAVPNFENGVAAGYKLFQIVPGSIYDKLGLQNGDVITGLNGSPINDPGKAFEMISELKTSNHLELQVKKEGKPSSTYTYDIH